MTQNQWNERVWIPLAVLALAAGLIIPKACGEVNFGYQPFDLDTVVMGNDNYLIYLSTTGMVCAGPTGTGPNGEKLSIPCKETIPMPEPPALGGHKWNRL